MPSLKFSASNVSTRELSVDSKLLFAKFLDLNSRRLSDGELKLPAAFGL